MKNASHRIRFCDEYELLLEEFLKALAAWSQMRCFHEQCDATDSFAHSELARSCRNYVAALWALRMHSRHCVVCEEMLRIHINQDTAHRGLTAVC
jgi:hypothetical protein